MGIGDTRCDPGTRTRKGPCVWFAPHSNAHIVCCILLALALQQCLYVAFGTSLLACTHPTPSQCVPPHNTHAKRT